MLLCGRDLRDSYGIFLKLLKVAMKNRIVMLSWAVAKNMTKALYNRDSGMKTKQSRT